MVVDLCTRAGLESVILSRDRDIERDYHRILKRDQSYSIVFENPSSTRTIRVPVHYYRGDTDESAVQLLAAGDVTLITTSVRKDNLPAIAPLLARAIDRRSADAGHLCILACENFLQNSICLKKYVEVHLSPDAKLRLRDRVFFL